MIAPCLNCQERHFKCHSACDKYAAFSSQQKRIYAEREATARTSEFYKAVSTRLANRNYV